MSSGIIRPVLFGAVVALAGFYLFTFRVNPDEAAAFRKTFGTDKLAVPSVTIGSQKQQGFEEGAWGGMLNNAGYPRSAANGASAPAPAAK